MLSNFAPPVALLKPLLDEDMGEGFGNAEMRRDLPDTATFKMVHSHGDLLALGHIGNRGQNRIHLLPRDDLLILQRVGVHNRISSQIERVVANILKAPPSRTIDGEIANDPFQIGNRFDKPLRFGMSIELNPRVLNDIFRIGRIAANTAGIADKRVMVPLI